MVSLIARRREPRSFRPRSYRTIAAGIVACGIMTWTVSAQADAVTDWNEIAVAAQAAGRPGPIGQTDLALVHLAMHDAVQAIDRRYDPYFAEVPGARGSRSAAAVAAAYNMLVGMYPAQASSLDTTYYNYVAQKGLDGNAGLDVGKTVATKMLPLRRVNPDPLPPPFVGGTNPGQWRPTESFNGSPPSPPSGAPMATPWMARFHPFTLTGSARFRADAPPALTSERYALDYEEVKAFGSLTGSARSPEQTDVGYFWTDNFFVQWNRGLRAHASKHVHDIGDSARLFALANVAIADSVISAWDSKVHYYFWRPITAIREGNNDGNPDTIGDTEWRPLINNPNYPDYTSGANVISGTMTRLLKLYFGRDRMTFELTSNAPLAVRKTRTYTRYSDIANEVVDARVYLGIHFRFADEAARLQGERVAEHAFRNFLQPCRGSKSGFSEQFDTE
jgi:hypothetical protein